MSILNARTIGKPSLATPLKFPEFNLYEITNVSNLLTTGSVYCTIIGNKDNLAPNTPCIGWDVNNLPQVGDFEVFFVTKQFAYQQSASPSLTYVFNVDWNNTTFTNNNPNYTNGGKPAPGSCLLENRSIYNIPQTTKVNNTGNCLFRFRLLRSTNGTACFQQTNAKIFVKIRKGLPIVFRTVAGGYNVNVRKIL